MNIQPDILGALKPLTEQHGVRLLYAVESGSRAWGIESPDSDWDVRFFHVHDAGWYLRLHEGRDVIERMDGDLDFSGWDLRKALRLAHKSNPGVLEWLRSPIIYAEEDCIETLRGIMRDFSPRALIRHYTSQANNQKKSYWSEGRPVLLKKYLYAVRPLLAVLWMVDNDYAMPPIRLSDIRAPTENGPGVSTGEQGEAELEELLANKAVTSELEGKGRYPALDEFIDGMLARGPEIANAAPERQPDLEALNALFRSLI